MKTKKKIFTKNGTFFPPNLRVDLRSDAHQSQIIGEEADVDHTQIIGGDTVKIFGGYIPQIFFSGNLQTGKKKSEQIFRKVSGIFQPSFDLSKSIVLSSAKDLAIFEDLRLRGQGQGFDL